MAELMWLEPTVAADTEEGDKDEAMVVAAMNLWVVGEGEAAAEASGNGVAGARERIRGEAMLWQQVRLGLGALMAERSWRRWQ